MRRTGIVVGILACLALALLSWAPWLSAEAAQKRAKAAFRSAWYGVADGCGFSCQGCGAVGATRAPFGWWVELEYACGMLPPADLPEDHHRDRIFVSALGTVHGIRRR